MSVLRKEPAPFLNVPLSDALLTVNTIDGLRVDKATGYYIQTGQTPYDINVYKSQTLFSGAVERVALTEINMPYNIPNVNKTNNILYFKEESAPTVDVGIQIDQGFYTPAELASAIRMKLNGVVIGSTTIATPLFGIDPLEFYWDCIYLPQGRLVVDLIDSWDATKANYAVDAIVFYAGYNWKCIQANPPAGTFPTVEAYWEKEPDEFQNPSVAFGSAFAIYNTSVYTDVWSNTTNYVDVGDIVIYEDLAYESIQANNLGNQPDTSTLWWRLYNDGDSHDTYFQIDPKLGKPTGSVDGIPRRDTLATMMGFASSSPVEYSYSIIGNYATCLYTNYIDIVSDIICKHQDVRDTSTNYATGNNILARVYIASDIYESINDTGNNIIGTRPFVLHYNLPVPKQIQWSPYEFLPSANIQLRDDKGQLLYAPNLTTEDEFIPDVLPDTIALTKIYSNTAFVQLTFHISEAKMGESCSKFT
jgi:hypothetical protein